jgi:DNA-binding NarL/FixJ family response regulator
VLRLISAGRTARQIGEELALSPKTVATYRSRICEKLQLRTAAELVAFAVRHRMFE